MPSVAKKRPGGKGKRDSTMVRVSVRFAEALLQAASFEGGSMAEFADAHLLPVVQKRYRDAVIREAKRLESGET